MPNNPRGVDLAPDHVRRFRSMITREKLRWSIDVAQLDPDGIGCAVGTLEIQEALGVEGSIFYGGGFDDPQNSHIRKIFKLDGLLRPISEMPEDGPIALVDSCRLKDARFGRKIDPRRIRIVTDHHKPDERLAKPWRFVHICQTGAAATLVWRQGKALGVRFSKRAATLIAVGILSDTNKFRGPCITNADRYAFAEAAEQADQKLLARSHAFKLPKRYYKLAGETFLGARQIGSLVYAHPNRRMHQAESGYVSHFADDLLYQETCMYSLAWCLTEDRIRVSVRADDPKADLGALIASVFGAEWGGAKNGSGGAQVPLTALPGKKETFDDQRIAVIDAYIVRRLERFLRA